MIDVRKCEYDESFSEEDFGCVIHYFNYPKDMDEIKFDDEKEYGNVVGMCISLSVYDNGIFDMQMSPTIETEEGGSFIDVEWRPMREGENYTEETVHALLNLVPERKIK